LDVDLREGVFIRITQSDEAIVKGEAEDRHEHRQRQQCKNSKWHMPPVNRRRSAGAITGFFRFCKRRLGAWSGFVGGFDGREMVISFGARPDLKNSCESHNRWRWRR
jgi:hypothetical protein